MSSIDIDRAAPADPLGFMQRLSPSVTYYEPTTSTIASGSSNSRADPELVLLSTWMGARENHIAKYVQGYRVIFPTSRILVAQCPFTHVVMPFLAWTQIRPAVPILKEVVESETRQKVKDDDSSVLTGNSTAPRVLIHAFSNGGISSTLFLYNALKRSLGGKFTLPQHVFIFDSCPGTFRWRNTARAIMKILPRWSSPAVHAVLFSIWLFYRIIPVLQPRQNVNSRTIRNPRFQEFEARRTYLYGTSDQMIPPTDVEHEAGLAAEAEFNVRLERFEDATHVAIPMSHPERYWRVVRESWYGEEPTTSIVVQASDGGHEKLEAEISSETVARRISLVDNEKSISEEAGILVEDIKNDGKETIAAVEKSAQKVSKSAQSTLENATAKSEEIKKESGAITAKAQLKAQDLKADAHAAIEKGQATLKQLKANAAGTAKEMEPQANKENLSKEVNTVVENLETAASHSLKDAEQATKEAKTDVAAPLLSAAAKPKQASEGKGKHAERFNTPDTSAALQAAIAAAASSSSSPEAAKASSSKTHGRSSSSSSVQELAARFGGKVEKSAVKLPKSKAPHPELTKADDDDELVVVAKPIEPKLTTAEDKRNAEQPKVEPKVEQPKQSSSSSSSKSKKSKKNGKK
ncbi:hypothetical protein G3M48_004722 [Beauveria asiatica]|uniref:Indole-diterpene biosynthesis protein PaxU n=1 Tax=Beauveria asiatica TaxID=1069075 RepID=A0AAW0RT87_9HYPO